MKNTGGALLLGAFLFLVPPAVAKPSIDSLIEKELPALVAAYQLLHAAPELSGQEEKTSAYLATELRGLGYDVTEGIGKYRMRPWKGYGVIAVMKNGAGPTVLVRADMDALPVEEKTNLPYASNVRTKNDKGQEVGVMHACGHDIHMAVLLGTAKVLVQLKDEWQGTVMMVGQPAEELGGGARAMLDDGAYTRFPRPDYALALHDTVSIEAGKVGYTPGCFNSAANSVEIVVRGVGGHGASPENTKDPIVMAAQLVLALQTVVSREKSPLDPAVVTVGSIHGGSSHNIIPDEVRLELTIRTYDKKVRDKIFQAIERIAKGVAQMAGVPEDRAPIVKFRLGLPATYNQPELSESIAGIWKKELGEENVLLRKPVMGSEDFGVWGLGGQIPVFMFWLGAADPEQLKTSRQTGVGLPASHSPLFAPVPEPTIRTGVKAMATAVLDLLKKPAASEKKAD
jgi:hippurate hydrolase